MKDPWQGEQVGEWCHFGHFLLYHGDIESSEFPNSEVEEALALGEQYAEKATAVGFINLNKQRRVLQKRFKEKPLYRELSAYHPWKDLYQAVFWYAAYSVACAREQAGYRQRNVPYFGGNLQRYLIRALYHVPQPERERIRHFPDSERSIWSEWSNCYVGAMSVAKTAYALHLLGIRPILPTIDIDIRSKIDLLGKFLDTEKSYVCLQIKAARYLDNPTVRIVSLDPTRRQQDAEGHGLKENVLNFINKQGIRKTTAAIVYTGLNGSPQLDSEHLYPLMTALADALR